MICGILLALKKEKGLERLTNNQPTAMVKICGKPAAQYGLELFGRNGVRRALLITEGPCTEAEASFGGETFGTATVQVARTGENSALAAIKKVARSKDNLIVLDGAVLTEFPLRDALRTHRIQKADVTLVMATEKGPKEYNNEQLLFSVILSPRAIEKLPPQGELCSALWDWMGREGLRICTVKMSGIGLPLTNEEELLNCQSYLLRASGQWGAQPRDGEGNIILSRLPADCRITSPIYVGRHVTVGRGVELKSGCVLEDHVLIGANSCLKDVTVTTGTTVPQYTDTSCAILCPQDIKSDLPHPTALTKMSCALGTLYRGKNIVVATASSELDQSLGMVALGALTAAGAQVKNFGVCTWGAFIYGFSPRAAEAGVYISQQGIICCAPGGLPFTAKIMGELNQLLRLEALDPAPIGMGQLRTIGEIESDYASFIHSAAPSTLWGIRCRIICPNLRIQHLGNSLLQQLGCRPGGDKLVLDELGKRGELQCEDGRIFTWDDILTVLCAVYLELGKDVALPDCAATAAEGLLDTATGKILRYHAATGRSRDTAARSLAMDTLWTRDALLAGVTFLSELKKGSLTTTLMSKYNKTIQDNLCKLH